MPKTAYHISLKGYVGGYDFDRSTVDRELAKNEGKQVNVLIDSLGGSLATGLSISAAFKNHGNVNVHFVGLNASAATIASLGAAHISIDAGAMYLVHQCSMAFFEWGSLNSDQFATLIADCEKIKADLDKLDLNCAQLYARKCRKPTADLLALMKVGGWLTAKEALDWGFVDEITDLADEPAPKLTDSLASAMANAGIPIPHIPLAEPDKESAFAKFISALTSFFRPNATVTNTLTTAMNKTFTFLCAVLGITALELTNNKASLSDEQLSAIENHLADLGKKVEDRDKTIADLQAKLAAKPAVESKQVVEDSKPGEQQPKNDVEQFVDTYNSARALFDEV
ncbi:MAG: ATP-dependent Clp protease proteolytic subunit [Muribaculaceae bacterium]|nr:ATP-dependent Clp protease proteolytic subunit [Muribaculaceae bacterium]